MRTFFLILAAVGLVLAVDMSAQRTYRTLNDTFAPPQHAARDEWMRRAAYIREHILASAGLLPMPERTPLQPVFFGEVRHPDYTVSKAYFEALLGLFQLAFECALLGLGSRQIVLGAQYQKVGFDDPDDQVLLVGGKGSFRFPGDFLAGLKAEPGR